MIIGIQKDMISKENEIQKLKIENAQLKLVNDEYYYYYILYANRPNKTF